MSSACHTKEAQDALPSTPTTVQSGHTCHGAESSSPVSGHYHVLFKAYSACNLPAHSMCTGSWTTAGCRNQAACPVWAYLHGDLGLATHWAYCQADPTAESTVQGASKRKHSSSACTQALVNETTGEKASSGHEQRAAGVADMLQLVTIMASIEYASRGALPR